jgi:hypothetical protein
MIKGNQSAWREVGRLKDQTYDWPPEGGGRDEFDPFILYRENRMTLALAQNVKPTRVKDRPRKQIWVFKVDDDGSRKDPISPFVAADDYDDSRELVAIIRGKGETGRQMYSPGDQLPPPYGDLKVEILGDRIKGHYNKYCVVAHEDDAESMLRHGAARLRLRG